MMQGISGAPGVSGNAQAPFDPFVMNQQQKDWYVQLFNTMDTDRDGEVSQPEAVGYFMQSGLPMNALVHIYQMCDLNKDGKLDMQEFICAIHIVMTCRYVCISVQR
ncbi:uncharacterized protein [Blastocystis hominis]|uniref:Uncharacterized protein n=1 Tax=Blastocystis hominis TaxID=12968 RepID=D8LZD6_BLAHO|nr:uncharacterized protein [Blastocystis hominis]CBK21175.2 unnamed protein product [Blastocystis hominis]|eukprot:XP_012895223.1 uncharacterized protein [Blastocystis hominis]